VSVNINDPVFDEPRGAPGFNCTRSRLGRQLGLERTGLSLWRLPPGEAAYPYHWHVSEEEVILVVKGEPSLRTPEGWRVVAEGEVLAFPTGDAGAHQLANRTESEVEFLTFSNQQPDIVVYPDSDKIGFSERRTDGSGIHGFFRRGDQVPYFEGEEAP